jgi:hypothetical protein
MEQGSGKQLDVLRRKEKGERRRDELFLSPFSFLHSPAPHTSRPVP